VLFAEGEEDVVLRAAIAFRDGGYGIPLLVGRDDVYDRLKELGVDDPQSFEVYNSRKYARVPEMVDFLYGRLQRRGYMHRELERLVNQDRNIFASLLLAMGEADVMITGVTRPYAQGFRQIRRVLDPQDGVTPFGIHLMVGQSHTVFIADTTVTERPTGEQLAEIAIQTAQVARRMGHEPRVAFLSYSNFGNPEGSYLERIRDAVKVMDRREDVDFEYEGEMSPDTALDPDLQKLYPFMRLTGPANVLVMPGLQTANISAKLLRELGGDAVIGPMLVGMKQQVQIAAMSASASDLVTLAVLGAGRIVR
jgi:malate dehydrogenase (oxaloacetate-decarboxylating)(NADP+)